MKYEPVINFNVNIDRLYDVEALSYSLKENYILKYSEFNNTLYVTILKKLY